MTRVVDLPQHPSLEKDLYYINTSSGEDLGRVEDLPQIQEKRIGSEGFLEEDDPFFSYALLAHLDRVLEFGSS